MKASEDSMIDALNSVLDPHLENVKKIGKFVCESTRQDMKLKKQFDGSAQK